MNVARSYEAGLPDPRISVIEKRAPTLSTAKISVTKQGTGEDMGFLYIYEGDLRNTTETPTTFQYTPPASPEDPIDIIYPEQGGATTRQLVLATKHTFEIGLNSPTADATKKSDFYGMALPVISPAGSPPVLSAVHQTWFESCVWRVGADNSLTATWINPDGTPVPFIPFFMVEQLHFSPNTDILHPWGGPWFDMIKVDLKLVN
jgi:hypothetical protein